MSKKPLSPGYRFQAQILEFCIYSLITISVLVLFAFILILVNHFKTPADASILTNKLLPFGFFFSVITLFVPIILTTKRKAMIGYSICSIQIVNTDDSEISNDCNSRKERWS